MHIEFTLPTPAVPIQGGDSVFPVRRIYCVGRNYAAHAREMGFDPNREPPFFFCKPADAIVNVPPGTTVEVPYPPKTSEYHHEIELVVAIGRAGSDIAVEDALDHVFGYAVGLDMTRRDLQLALRDKGRPWELGKAFDQSAPIAPLYRASEVGHIDHGALWVQVNGEDRQRTDLSKLIWSVPEIIANLSTYFELQPGDLIYTGTPEGVGPVHRGDIMTGGITGLGELSVKVR
ncbi:fumarylacetoacetate hydrolase family protein [Paraburkholderia madseniana]|jgi:fumarylpyruvate hydrolase|uniref:Fumarylacetoacetate hydrolase family protein n=1 Tax=Paraburkholderia madseniana TaxID=2599607 RepID=A0AAP5BC62_9BURK|nr:MULTISPECIES: fumarylacetoacetate hydrolase family protein [Paraburkholderia]MCX4145899.1 fumarylacetoacetate hydrolase family protein [Paraburkholderia madseniana]MDN7148847.1 fumarylacetoacetate hydrolase family protein [Paraburkholderia sp. WS6]MDQ6407727.1 fumarylacetoacetate hydrolase family protein [Paraburkholderia madseniana]